jgi:hypothetical protein
MNMRYLLIHCGDYTAAVSPDDAVDSAALLESWLREMEDRSARLHGD